MTAPYEALNRLCLNNWHYIDRKILKFHKEMNFFTGHSGSGKSTVIDALQILLYANTDGRGFFNKAATDESDRTLMEYLRGMVSVDDNNSYTYLRNEDFSSTIVMELERTDTRERQCIGVAFDVSCGTNNYSKIFFWHKGSLPAHGYRTPKRAMTIDEIRTDIRSTMNPEDYYFETTNERFRAKMYSDYLGGLNPERFPRLFKRAIPFRMNMKLSEFVREYICMEQEIHIEDMQESVTQYGRLCRRIRDIQAEVEELTKIRSAFDRYQEKEREVTRLRYFQSALEVLELRELETSVRMQVKNHQEDVKKQELNQKEMEKTIGKLEEEKEKLIGKINASGYEELLASLKNLYELQSSYGEGVKNWQDTVRRLKEWEEQEITPNPVLWKIESFEKGTIPEEELRKLREEFDSIQKDVRRQKSEAESEIRRIRREKKEAEDTLKELRQGSAAYPKELEEVRSILRRELQKKAGHPVPVEILADLLEVRDDAWRNAVEGYMAGNKLLLVVPPGYAKDALEIYRGMDKKKYFKVAVLDTEKVAEKRWEVRPRALSEEIETKNESVRAYVDFLMGRVIKCETIDELREQNVGITRTCELYSGFKFQHIDPKHYTRFAYIGEMSRRQRIRLLEEQIRELEEELEPLLEVCTSADQVLELEMLPLEPSVYLGWMEQKKKLAQTGREIDALTRKIEELQKRDVDAWKKQKDQLQKRVEELRSQRDEIQKAVFRTQAKINQGIAQEQDYARQLVEKQKELPEDETLAAEFREYIEKKAGQARGGNGAVNYKNLRKSFQGRHTEAQGRAQEALSRLRQERVAYLTHRPNRAFDSERLDNNQFDELLEKLQYKDLDELSQRAAKQARGAVEIFKNDFIYKIRSAIKEAIEQKNELNRIIGQNDFGKDRYRFVVEKNKGEDGKFYPVFMDDNLEISPSALSNHLANQMDLFTMNHEEQYGELISELLEIFLPPENATAAELEEAKQNMKKYADYRTYLSFDMEQMVRGENGEVMYLKLDRMLRKNSGGEGQNPLYVALLASFVQAYRINLSPRLQLSPAIHLVILDEAFSKMDAEKVASCISLMRQFGFQAIISSTNDKIQSYLDSVDKTFLFANPNKRHISIQEFEKLEFEELRTDLEESED